MISKRKNIIDKLSYKLWKHLNKRYGTNTVPGYIQCVQGIRNVENSITALSNELDRLKTGNDALFAEQSKEFSLEIDRLKVKNEALLAEQGKGFSLETASLRRLSVINYKSGKKPLNVLFLCSDKDVFCLETLFRLMRQSEEFQPVVGVFPYEHVDPKIKFDASKYEKIVQWLEQKQMKHVPLYDFEKKEYLSLKKVQPDIVFFNSTLGLKNTDRFLAEASNAITCFVPYGYFLSNSQEFVFDNDFNYKMTYLFWETAPFADLSERRARNKGENSFFQGYPKLDPFFDGHSPENVWKTQSAAKKKIVWAPHHSIENDPDHYGYSCFNELADVMLELAEKYRDKAQFAFRPHPLLRSRLNADERWGEQRTAEYYQKWEQRENTQLSDGDYVDLLLTSDAMIGDSVSFMCEYSAIDKPYCFTTRDDTVSRKFNELGKDVFNRLLYKAPPLSDEIENFLQNVVLNGNDPLSEKRRAFAKENLLPPDGKSASENIFNFLKKELRL